jgi:hypothetical protein
MTQVAEFEVPFEVPAKVVYEALLDPMYISFSAIIFRELTKFTRTPAKMDPQVGGEFNLYAGKIQGKNLELVRPLYLKIRV